MTKIIKVIITLTIIFSSLSNTFAEEGYIENLFDLNYWVEELDLNLHEIKYIHFNNEKYNRIYREIKTVDSLLKNGFMKNYREWIYDYYQMNWIVSSYNKFIYNTNLFLYFIKIKEENNQYSEVNPAIINSYRNMNIYYSKVKNLAK
jgi:hypothetical protein